MPGENTKTLDENQKKKYKKGEGKEGQQRKN
jgi:hypothetical protein